MSRALVCALAALVAALGLTGADAAAKKRRPPPIRIVQPGALALAPDGSLVVADRKLKRVVRVNLRTKKRKILARFSVIPQAITYDDLGRLYIGAGERIFRLDRGRKVLVAGNGRRGHAGDGGPAPAAELAGAGGFEVDHDKTIVLSEYDNTIRGIDPDGTIRRLAGTGAEGYSGDGGPAVAALIRHPHDIALQADHEFVIADSHNGVLRKVDRFGRIHTLSTGFIAPVIVDGGPLNSLYVADAQLGAIFRIDSTGLRMIRGGLTPMGMAMSNSGAVYVSEFERRRVVRISPSGRLSVVLKR